MNTIEIPRSYLPGLQILECFASSTEMERWLLNELNETEHLLAGGHNDQPVQAILNHARFLNLRASGLLRNAVMYYVSNMGVLEESAARHLLNLASELPVVNAKYELREIVKKRGQDVIRTNPLLCALLQTIATLSTDKEDVEFWKTVAEERPEFSGMAFQVLLRLSEKDAWEILYDLISDKDLAGGIIRGLSGHLDRIRRKTDATVAPQ